MEPSSVVLSKNAILSASRSQNWEELWVVLLSHTIKRLKYRYGIKENIQDLKVRARDHLSSVMQAILVEGDRNWNTVHYATFENFVISVIDSELYNTFKKKPSREITVAVLPDLSQSANIEDVIRFKELRNQVYSMLELEKASDEELLVFECMADGIVKPMHIRSELGIDDTTFRRVWRNLQAKLEKIGNSLSLNG